MAKIVEALKVHQHELEMQNEELRLAKEKADLAIEKYTEMYDFAPAGYYTLSRDGDIVELNLYGSRILGKERKYLQSSRFGFYVSDDSKPTFNSFLGKIFSNNTKETCEVMLIAADQSVLNVHLTGVINEHKEQCLLTAVDITELKQSQRELSESKVRLDKTQKIAHLGSWELTLNSGCLIWSDEVYRIFGFEFEDFGGTYEAFIETVHPDDRENLETSFYNSLQGENTGFEVEHRIVCRDTGEIRHVWEKCEHIRDASGKVVRSLGMVQDITKNKQAELALSEKEKKFRSFFQYSSDPIFSFNIDESYQFVNEAFSRPFGMSPLEVIGKTPYDLFSFDEAEKRLAIVRKVFLTGETHEIEVRVDAPSGDVRTYLTTADPIKNDLGQVIYVNCSSKEITQIKNTEQTLKEREAQIAALLAAIPDMIFILDNRGVFIDYHGPISTELYAYPKDFVGKNVHDVIPPDIAHQFELVFEEAIRTDRVQLFEYSLMMQEGQKYFESKVVAYDDNKILTIIRNVSPYRQALELINQKNKDLQIINGEKDKFFSIIAHDLRSPFSGFLGLTESLAKRLPNMTLNEIQQITSLMRNAAAHLFRLLGNLLEWSLMQRGLTAFIPKKFLLSKKIAESVDLVNLVANQKEISIDYQIPEELEIFADENMFESIIRNLFSNAVKYTYYGGNIYVSATKSSENWIVISVRDTGIGMSKALIDNLFRLDVQSNRKGTEGEYSTGLGLIICKDFIDKHNGKLWIESEEGKGSTFSFSLPGENLY